VVVWNVLTTSTSKEHHFPEKFAVGRAFPEEDLTTKNTPAATAAGVSPIF
jgi:hypothetical protein